MLAFMTLTLLGCSKRRPARPQRTKRRGVLFEYVEPLSEARTPLEAFFSSLDDGGVLFPPKPIKLFQLGQGREVRHPVEEHFPDEVIQLMLNAHGI
jgi:hypothetical protein